MQALAGATVSLEQLLKLKTLSQSLGFPHGHARLADNHGAYPSRLRGRGMDYAESRHYQAGDDIRTMDWRVTARTGKAHVKVYHEERERPVFLILQLNRSMFFGSRVAFKSVRAAEALTLLAWSASLRGDRVGGLIAHGNTHHEVKPKARQAGVLTLLKSLTSALAAPPTQDESLEKTLESASRLLKPGSLVVVLSDFQTVSAELQRPLQRLSQQHEVLLGWIYDPLEAALPESGCYAISDGQDATLINTASRTLRQAYQQQFSQHQQALLQMCHSLAISYFLLATPSAALQVLQHRFPARRIAT